jgi:CBS domain-containing protein
MIKKILKATSIEENVSVLKIAKIMKQKKIRHVFVCDKKGTLKGIISESDIVRKVVAENKKPEEVLAKEIMVSPVLAVEINDNPEKALAIMNKIKTLTCPVTKNKKLVGIVHYQSIVNQIYEEMRKKK